jgi:hypothetical protein
LSGKQFTAHPDYFLCAGKQAQREHESSPRYSPGFLPAHEGSKRMARRKVKNHWFVSVAVPKQGHAQGFVRRTETFPTEDDAKQFAKEMLSEKHHIFAGTLLSAHLPVRRIISGSQLYSWVGVKADPSLIRLETGRARVPQAHRRMTSH